MVSDLRICTDERPLTSHRSFSYKLFRYLLFEYLVILFCCVCAFLALFIIISLFDDLEDFLRHDAQLKTIFHYVLLLQPKYLVNVIPISLLISTIYVLSNLSKYHEITAFRASGISIFHFCLPITVIAILTSFVHFAISEKLVPHTQKIAATLKRDLTDPYKKRPINEKSYLAYRNREGGRNWFFEIFSTYGTCFNVTISQFRPDGTNQWELISEEGKYGEGGWIFKNSLLREFDKEGYLVVGEPKMNSILKMPELDENPMGFSFLFKLKPLDELSASKIHDTITNGQLKLTEETESVLKTYFYHYIFLPFSCLISVFLSIPLGITQERKSVTKNFIIAIALIGLYHLATQFFIILGKINAIPPLCAGILPPLIFGIVCIVLMRRKF